MTTSFDHAPTYDLGARPPADADWVALAWPVWAVQVRVRLVGRSALEDLDLFEAAVLDLCVAGERRRRSIAADLDLDPELVSHVVGELQRREFIDRDLAPTQSGEEVLNLRHSEREHHAIGFVLLDARTGNGLPGFHGALEPLEQDDQRGPGSDRRWGSTRVTVERQSMRMIHVPATRSAPDLSDTSTQAAVRASLTHGSKAIGSHDTIGGVGLFDGHPRSARVLVWAYRRKAGEGDHRWALDRDVRVLDPTGLDDAVDLEQALQQLRGEPGYPRALNVLHTEEGDVDARNSILARERALLLARLGDVDVNHGAIDELTEALVLRSDQWAANALVRLGAALETTLRAAATDDEYRDAQLRLRPRNEVVPVLQEALSACGFDPKVPPGTVNSLLGRQHGTLLLRSLAALIVLIAADDESHPLRSLAIEEAEDAAMHEGRAKPVAWLAEVDDLAHARNAQAHGLSPGDSRPNHDASQLDRWFHLVERTAAHLLRTA